MYRPSGKMMAGDLHHPDLPLQHLRTAGNCMLSSDRGLLETEIVLHLSREVGDIGAQQSVAVRRPDQTLRAGIVLQMTQRLIKTAHGALNHLRHGLYRIDAAHYLTRQRNRRLHVAPKIQLLHAG